MSEKMQAVMIEEMTQDLMKSHPALEHGGGYSEGGFTVCEPIAEKMILSGWIKTSVKDCQHRENVGDKLCKKWGIWTDTNRICPCASRKP